MQNAERGSPDRLLAGAASAAAGVEDAVLDEALDYRKMARPHD